MKLISHQTTSLVCKDFVAPNFTFIAWKLSMKIFSMMNPSINEITTSNSLWILFWLVRLCFNNFVLKHLKRRTFTFINVTVLHEANLDRHFKHFKVQIVWNGNVKYLVVFSSFLQCNTYSLFLSQSVVFYMNLTNTQKNLK